jgi:hypothetical protein
MIVRPRVDPGQSNFTEDWPWVMWPWPALSLDSAVLVGLSFMELVLGQRDFVGGVTFCNFGSPCSRLCVTWWLHWLLVKQPPAKISLSPPRVFGWYLPVALRTIRLIWCTGPIKDCGLGVKGQIHSKYWYIVFLKQRFELKRPFFWSTCVHLPSEIVCLFNLEDFWLTWWVYAITWCPSSSVSRAQLLELLIRIFVHMYYSSILHTS